MPPLVLQSHCNIIRVIAGRGCAFKELVHQKNIIITPPRVFPNPIHLCNTNDDICHFVASKVHKVIVKHGISLGSCPKNMATP